ncbi:MAG: glycosyltransferase family 4 protein [Desulfuromonadales bacterium]|nr:glycosyltransferase family 4 protein [Desulfuromonadales bacterium]
MTKRVLHFIDSGGLYGAESVILNLSREMQSKGEFEPVVGCIVSQSDARSDLYDKCLELGIRAEKLVIRNACFFLDIPQVARKLKSLNISIIHSHGYKPSVYGFIVSVLISIPITATCHLWFLHGNVPLKMRVMITLELLFYKIFPVIVAVSEPIKMTLLSHGICSSKVKVINNGIVLDDYLPVEQGILERIRAELHIDDGELCLLNVARLNSQKAQCHIIDAAAQLKLKGEKLKFFIVGEGELMDKLKQQVCNNDLQQTVYLLGFRSDVKTLLQVADIFILPSLDEGMPIALLEAVASRTPVLATPVGNIPKLIQNNHSGVLVKRDDVMELVCGIQHMAASSELREKCAEQAWEAIRDVYSSKAMYKSYHAIYNDLLG